MPKFIIYAPNVASGGGLVLLRALLAAWPEQQSVSAILDDRGRDWLASHIGNIEHTWVTSSVRGRLLAEWQLYQTVRPGDVVLCFHNLPPIFPSRGKVLCYVHNPNIVGLVPPNQNSGWVRVRYVIENFIFSIFQNRISEYMVQTPSMEAALRRRIVSKDVNIHVTPFLDYSMMPHPKEKYEYKKEDKVNVLELGQRFWDFLYISDGVPHKNHINLIAAWEILAKEGYYPSIAVTLRSDRDAQIINLIEHKKAILDLRIDNIGQLPHKEVLKTYQRCRAFLFASFAESFGIPLMEAKASNLPIIAAEMDFVRDVCDPFITFDPHSPISIARAVKRFFECESPAVTPLTPELFNEKIISLI